MPASRTPGPLPRLRSVARGVALALAIGAFGACALSAAPAAAQALSEADRAAYRAAFTHVAAGRWGEAESAAAAAAEPLPAKVVRWLRLMARSGNATPDELADFLARNPDWPGRAWLAERLDEALAASSDDALVLRHFRARPPATAEGLQRFGSALLGAGETVQARAALRAAWLALPASEADEAGFLRRSGAHLRPEDHAHRFHRLANAGDIGAAARLLPAISARDQGVARLRVALQSGSEITPAIEGQLRRHLDHAGLALDFARWLRRADREGEAAEFIGRMEARVLAAADAPTPEQWWPERQRIARRLIRLQAGNLAYQAVHNHGLAAGEPFVDAEFMAGWISLRFRADAVAAGRHFERLYGGVSSVISKGRAAYWAARAASGRGDAAAAERWYAEAAGYPTSFYGQLAALSAPEHATRFAQALRNGPVPAADPAARAAIEGHELARAARLLVALDQDRRARLFLRRLFELAASPAEQAVVTRLASSLGPPELGVDIARRTAQRGLVLVEDGFPVPLRPPADGPEPALLLALMRQESNFDTRAVSRAGARGLMQLMPATARQVARSTGRQYNLRALTANPRYNMALGSHYLAGLLDRFGSVPLALAGYNAGPHRVRQWLEDHGDPRTGAIDLIDWIELIPFGETRNYVQRVLEGLAVYRARLGHADALAGHPMLDAREIAEARRR